MAAVSLECDCGWEMEREEASADNNNNKISRFVEGEARKGPILSCISSILAICLADLYRAGTCLKLG